MKLGLPTRPRPDRRQEARSNGRAARSPRRSLVAGLASRIGYRTRSLIVALILAVVAVLLANAYLTSYKEDVERGTAEASVFVAARDIPAGTQGDELVARDLVERREIPRRSVVPGAISSVAQVSRLVAGETVYDGEQISTRRFRPATEQGLRGRLRGNLRAMAVSGDANQVLAGIVRDGDHVDVVASLKRGGGAGGATGESGASAASGGDTASRVILRDLLVVQAPDAAAGKKGLSSQTGSAVILALSDSQSQRLFFAMKNGQWSLVLRPASGAAESPGTVDDADSVLGNG